MMRVFIAVSPDIGVEISEQSLDRGEGMDLLKNTLMPVIPFARFIVVAEDADPSVDQGKPVFQRMPAAGQHASAARLRFRRISRGGTLPVD
jgi:hypothetical protein